MHSLIQKRKTKNYAGAVITFGFIILLKMLVLLSGCTSEFDQSTTLPSADKSASYSSRNANSFKEIEVEKGELKIDPKLMRVLEKLADTDEIDVLLYPRGQVSENLERFLLGKKKEGLLDYNTLQIANLIAIKGQKVVILEIANRDDVSRITNNPRFTTQ